MRRVAALAAVANEVPHASEYAFSEFERNMLAGIEPTARGFRIAPELPMNTFTISLPDIGVAYRPTSAHGYVVAAESGRLVMQVKAPAPGRWRVRVGARRVVSVVRGGIVTFTLRAQAHRAVGWDIRSAAAGS
jgi:hypothetical protein